MRSHWSLIVAMAVMAVPCWASTSDSVAHAPSAIIARAPSITALEAAAHTMLATGTPATASSLAAPVEHRRGEDQTFLTFPEWFLVFSPAEYAEFVAHDSPDNFVFWAHIRQFWQSYSAVTHEIIDRHYPPNVGYHVMIMVIGVSTTIEYAVRSAYETIVGRLSELSRFSDQRTQEDEYGARIAQDYVDFIRVNPWYEYDFWDRLKGLWRETTFFGPDMLRKWERKYALTTEYGVKAAYGWLIKKATYTAYERPIPVTTVLLNRAPDCDTHTLSIQTLNRYSDGSILITVPRYDAFMHHAAALARCGVEFREIAGNRSVILVSALTPIAWRPPAGNSVLFTQPILTKRGVERVALVVPITSLTATLNALEQAGAELEHVFDF
jgi:hypothetical protein